VPTIHESLSAAVAERISAMPEMAGVRVYDRLKGVPALTTYPAAGCVEVTVAGAPERVEPFDCGTTAPRYRYHYPAILSVMLRGDPKDPLKRDRYMAMRDAVMRKAEDGGLHGWRPPVEGAMRAAVDPAANVSGLMRARGEPGQTLDPQGPAGLKVAGSLVCWLSVIR
jgi:hypothetical protein